MSDSLAQSGDEARQVDALIVGGGPAGLMAAEMLGAAGHGVLLADAKPSVGRKFLMAGKSGLNLTKDEGVEVALRAYAEAATPLGPILRAFGPDAVQDWGRRSSPAPRAGYSRWR
jgi:predicted flavoprotein YhiN